MENLHTDETLKKKRLAERIIITVGALLLVYTVVKALTTNFNAGLIVVGFLAVAILAYGVLWDRFRHKKWVHAIAMTLCLILVAFSGFLAFYGNNDTVRYDEEVVIVLGAGVRGEQVTLTLASRLNKAIEYYEQNPAVLIIVSGGQGSQENITEALAMERYLIERGIPADQIIKEESSTSTYENFSFSRKILMQKFPEGCSVVFITNIFHIYRAERIAQYAGITARHMGASSEWHSVPVSYAREMLAVVQFWLFPPPMAVTQYSGVVALRVQGIWMKLLPMH